MKDKEKFHAAAQARFDATYSASERVRLLCHEAGRFCFVPGAQYEGYTNAGSDFEKLASRFKKFEVNKLRSEVMRIISEFKNSRVTAKFRPTDKKGSDELADKLNGKMQADSDDSQATESRNNAFTEAVSGGFGAYRFTTSAENDEDDDGPRRIVWAPVYDAAATAWFDVDSKLPDKSDGKYAFLLYSMSRAKYKEEYNKDPAGFDSIEWQGFHWANQDFVYVALYFERKLERVTLHEWQNPVTGHTSVYADDQLEQVKDELEKIGYRQINQKSVKQWRVYCSVIDGINVLEEPVRIPGKYIALIPVYGQRNYLDNIEYMSGHVQPSMDSQRLYNLSISAIAHTAAYGGRAIPIVNGAEIQGYEDEWERAQAEDLAYVRLKIPNDVTGANRTNYRAGMLGTTPVPQVAPAVAQLADVSNNDIAQTSASAQTQQEVPGNVAAETVASFMGRADMQAFTYLDNMAAAERHAARVWLSMAREVYGSEREVRIKRPNGDDEITYLSAAVVDDQTGQSVGLNDLTSGNYDVAIDVGPSFVTQRQATVAMLIELLGKTPPQSPYYSVLYAMLIQNVYAPGMEPLRDFNNKQMLLNGIVPPKTPQEAQEVQQAQQAQAQAAQTSPDAIYAQSQMVMAQAKEKTAMADEINAKARVLDTVTDIFVKEAQAYNYVKGADSKSIDSAMNVLKQVTSNLAEEASARFPQLS